MFFLIYLPRNISFTLNKLLKTMKIKNIEESQLIKAILILNDMAVSVFSFWLALGFIKGSDALFSLNSTQRVFIVLTALTVFPAFIIAPPLFIKRFIHKDHILSRVLFMCTIQVILLFALNGILDFPEGSGLILLLGYFVFFILLTCERIVLHYLLRQHFFSGQGQRNVIFVGHPTSLEDIYETLKDKSLGYKIKGIFTRKPIPESMQIDNLGHRTKVVNYLKDHPEITDLYLVPDSDYIAETREIYRYCENHLIRFYALPVFMEFLEKNMTLSKIGNTTLLSARKEPLQDPFNRLLKRSFDILISGLFLLTIFPWIYIVVALIIKHQSPGPVFFKQKRNGLDGKEFFCLKFRSMHVNKDADRVQATEHDPRKFKFGDIMRRTNIDELPQFINVFCGSMSMVGPRPHMLLHTQEYSQLINRYMVRHWVKPGITGWAQVQGFRGETKTLVQMENRVKADIWYVENWTFFLDLKIMWKTFYNMIKHNEKNAY